MRRIKMGSKHEGLGAFRDKLNRLGSCQRRISDVELDRADRCWSLLRSAMFKSLPQGRGVEKIRLLSRSNSSNFRRVFGGAIRWRIALTLGAITVSLPRRGRIWRTRLSDPPDRRCVPEPGSPVLLGFGSAVMGSFIPLKEYRKCSYDKEWGAPISP